MVPQFWPLIGEHVDTPHIPYKTPNAIHTSERLKEGKGPYDPSGPDDPTRYGMVSMERDQAGSVLFGLERVPYPACAVCRKFMLLSLW